MKKTTKIIILLAVIIVITISYFLIMGMNKSWINKINDDTEIELRVTYSPIDVYKDAPYVAVDSSKIDELKDLFEDVVCLRSFQKIFYFNGDRYSFKIYLPEMLLIRVMGNSFIGIFDLETGEDRYYEVLTPNFEKKLLDIVGDILPTPEKYA